MAGMRSLSNRTGHRLRRGCLALGLLYPPVSFGEAKPVKLDLTIIIDADSATVRKDRVNYQEKWKKSCQLLRNHFENGNMRFGHGPFQKVRCIDEPIKLDRALAKGKPSWVLRVIDSDESSGFEIYFLGGKKPRREASQLGSPSVRFIDGLKDKKVIKSVSLLLQDELPMFSVLSYSGQKQIEVESPLLPDPVPSEFVLYTLAFDRDDDVWIPRPVGYTKAENSGSGKTIKWPVVWHDRVIHDGTVIFAQNAAGRSQNRTSIASRLDNLLGRFGVIAMLGELTTSFHSNLSGIRYGIPIYPATDLVGKSTMLSMFTEVRSGPLNGLRLYYDKAPKVTDLAPNGEKIYFTWSTLSLGWSFKLPLPKFFGPMINRLDVQPKIGLVNLDTKLSGMDDYGTVRTAQFKLSNALNFGFESGIERDLLSFGLLRGWVGMLYSWAELGITKTHFTSLSYGVDAFWDLGMLGPFRIKALTFAATEFLSIGKQFKSPPDNATVDLSAEITDVSYQLVFWGIGATVAW